MVASYFKALISVQSMQANIILFYSTSFTMIWFYKMINMYKISFIKIHNTRRPIQSPSI